ncbi:PREDICTED: uncharacterized protein LOC108373533 [Rhagoletis zephyria]|uniref:uncharacterized protein LOC108373533 n=1 Tax=Rhagoletis zephyria TaxID=28612 RepID=UPI00081192F4|nr:PREDICTED: uncharacterized protein LOC108373533 [Rhagoletis zephyria]
MKVKKIRHLLLLILRLSSIALCAALPTNAPTHSTQNNSATTSVPNADIVPTTANVAAIDVMQNGLNEIESEYRVKYAQQMLTYMNQSVQPCEDFYEYACGNWKNVIPERQSQHKRSNLIDIVYSLGEAVQQLLQQDSSSFDNFQYTLELNKARRIYNDCLTADLYPVKYSQVYLDIIKSIGGFPAVDETWRPDNFSWFNMSAHLTNYGALGLIKEEIMPQYPFPPYFKLPDLGFEYIVHTDNIDTNSSHELNEKRMRNYLHLYGVNGEQKIERIIADIVETWRAILNITDEFHEDMNECEVLTAALGIDEFQQWNNYLDIAWNSTKFELEEETWPCHHFYNELDRVCNERKEAVANYLALKFIYRMDARLQDKKFQTEHCNMMIQHVLPHLLNEMYMKVNDGKNYENLNLN